MSTIPDPQRLLSELVSIPSPSGAEADLADFLSDRCESWGLDVERTGNSLILRAGRTGPRLFLNSHLDTVPVGAGWSADAFDPTWHDGRLVARGANDAKASVVAMLWALLELAQSDALEGELIVAFSACEEIDNSGMHALLEKLERLGLGRLDAAVTGEPTGLSVVRAQAGLAVLVAEWAGTACHAAHVSRVAHANALTKAVEDMAAIPSWIALEGEHPLLGKSTVAPTVFSSGERHNVVPDRARVTFDARLAPPHSARECAELLSASLPAAEVTVRSERLKPIETSEDHPLVRTALEITGESAAVGSNTLSDMALLQGVPCIKCGPGQTARSHTADEYVTADELLEGCRFYRALVPALFDALQGVPTL